MAAFSQTQRCFPIFQKKIAGIGITFWGGVFYNDENFNHKPTKNDSDSHLWRACKGPNLSSQLTNVRRLPPPKTTAHPCVTSTLFRTLSKVPTRRVQSLHNHTPSLCTQGPNHTPTTGQQHIHHAPPSHASHTHIEPNKRRQQPALTLEGCTRCMTAHPILPRCVSEKLVRTTLTGGDTAK